MRAFWGSLFSIIVAVGLFFGIVAIIGSQHNRNIIDEIKSWGQSSVVEEVVEETPTQNSAVILADIK